MACLYSVQYIRTLRQLIITGGTSFLSVTAFTIASLLDSRAVNKVELPYFATIPALSIHRAASCVLRRSLCRPFNSAGLRRRLFGGVVADSICKAVKLARCHLLLEAQGVRTLPTHRGGQQCGCRHHPGQLYKCTVQL